MDLISLSFENNWVYRSGGGGGGVDADSAGRGCKHISLYSQGTTSKTSPVVSQVSQISSPNHAFKALSKGNINNAVRMILTSANSGLKITTKGDTGPSQIHIIPSLLKSSIHPMRSSNTSVCTSNKKNCNKTNINTFSVAIFS